MPRSCLYTLRCDLIFLIKKETMMIKLKNNLCAVLEYFIFSFFFLTITNSLDAMRVDTREAIGYQEKTNTGVKIPRQLAPLNRETASFGDKIETDDTSLDILTTLQTSFKNKSELSQMHLQGASAVITSRENLLLYENAQQFSVLSRHTPQHIPPSSKTFFEELKGFPIQPLVLSLSSLMVPADLSIPSLMVSLPYYLLFYENAQQVAVLFRQTPQHLSPSSKTFFEELKRSACSAFRQFLSSSTLSFAEVPILPNLPLGAMGSNTMVKNANQDSTDIGRFSTHSLVLSLSSLIVSFPDDFFPFLLSCCFPTEEPKKNGRKPFKSIESPSSLAVEEEREGFFFSAKKRVSNVAYKISEFYEKTFTLSHFIIFIGVLITMFF